MNILRSVETIVALIRDLVTTIIETILSTLSLWQA